MKKILLIIATIAFSLPAAMAQSNTKAPAEKSLQELKREYASRVHALEDGLSRNHPEAAQKLYQEVAALMQKHIAITYDRLSKAADADKELMGKAIEQQNAMYSEAKILSADMMNKKAELIEKLREFQQTL